MLNLIHNVESSNLGLMSFKAMLLLSSTRKEPPFPHATGPKSGPNTQARSKCLFGTDLKGNQALEERTQISLLC